MAMTSVVYNQIQHWEVEDDRAALPPFGKQPLPDLSRFILQIKQQKFRIPKVCIILPCDERHDKDTKRKF